MKTSEQYYTEASRCAYYARQDELKKPDRAVKGKRNASCDTREREDVFSKLANITRQ